MIKYTHDPLKIRYISFLVHPAYLWLKKFNKQILSPVDEATQDIYNAGNLFESYVKKLFPGAIDCVTCRIINLIIVSENKIIYDEQISKCNV